MCPHLYVSTSLCVPISTCPHLYVSPSLCVHISMCLHLDVSPSLCVPISRCPHLYMSPYVKRTNCPKQFRAELKKRKKKKKKKRRSHSLTFKFRHDCRYVYPSLLSYKLRYDAESALLSSRADEASKTRSAPALTATEAAVSMGMPCSALSGSKVNAAVAALVAVSALTLSPSGPCVDFLLH